MGFPIFKKRGENKPFPHLSPSFPIPSTTLSPSVKIGEWLVSRGWVTKDQVRVALREQMRRPKRLGELMLDLGFVSPERLLTALSSLSNLPFISLAQQILEPSLIQQIPLEVAAPYQLILFQHDGQGFHVAMADPEDLLALDRLRLILGTKVTLLPYHATMGDIAQTIQVYYPQPTVDTHDGEVVRLVNSIILEAVRLRASDIHLSPTSHRIDIYYRQDGLLHLAHTFHKERWGAISVRLKIMASLDIAECRRPQNGRFSLTLGGREIDFRLSCHPTIHGENLVLRILDKAYSLISLDALGFEGQDIEIIRRMVQLPQGIIIVSGPTGAGKTTTLYAFLNYMDTLTRSIMTLEEPIEYYLPNIRQTEVREGGPFRFAEGIRSLLRQDPDVIFISEIRDEETAQIALRAAMTGHLVLATVHAPDSLNVLQRLADLGISPSLLKGNLIASIAQRLVRRLCENCCQPRDIMPQEHNKYNLGPITTQIYQAEGCPSCSQTGYRGREAVVELLLLDEELSNLMVGHHGQLALRDTLIKDRRFPTLRERGIQKVLSGKTTFSELERVMGAFL